MARRVGVGVCAVVLVALGGAPRVARAADEDLSSAEQQREQERQRYGELAQEALEEEIRQAISFLQSSRIQGDPTLDAELRMRLASAYGDMARYRWFAAMEAFQRDQEACFDRGEEGCEALEPDLGESHAFARQSLSAHQALLAGHPEYPRADEVWFRMGVLHGDLGQREEALRCHRALTERHPRSPFAPDALYAIGEHHIDDAEPYAALKAYRRAAMFRDSEVAPFALHKLAWCHYNVGDLDTAIDTLQQLLDDEGRTREGGERSRISLEEEALRDLVRFLAETGDPERALAVVDRHADRGEVRRLCWDLGEGYLAVGQPALAIRTFDHLLHDDPMAPDSPRVQAAIVDAYRSRDDLGRTLAATDRLVSDHGPDSAWRRANADHPEALSRADDVVERVLRRTAVEVHQQGLIRDDRDLLAAASERYGTYLTHFPDTADAYGLRFWYAEALFDLGRYDRAADEYERVVALDPTGKHLRDAAWNAIVAIERQIEANPRD